MIWARVRALGVGLHKRLEQSEQPQGLQCVYVCMSLCDKSNESQGNNGKNLATKKQETFNFKFYNLTFI